jgi:ATP-dependent exoDNAse (exonuclease V) alpha subunit
LAIYHLSAKIVHRAKGQSAVAAAAYRSGSLLHEDATGITHDYTRKRGVEHTEILAPEGAPDWVFDRQTLWNNVESAEKRKDAQLAREIEIGLPVELTQREQIALARDFARREFVAQGMVADLGVHLDNPQNPHAHILLTTRTLAEHGFGPKNRGLNDKRELLQWRRGWAEVTNEHLAEAGLAVRIDHRSYADQQLSALPGPTAGRSSPSPRSP